MGIGSLIVDISLSAIFDQSRSLGSSLGLWLSFSEGGETKTTNAYVTVRVQVVDVLNEARMPQA